jgi:cytoskeletal protein RodZ
MDETRAFGNYLRSERELRQIPLSEIATATKIPLHTLQRLEMGDWNDLPAKVFVRGFVRSYANHIGLSADEACQRFDGTLVEVKRRQAKPPEAVGDAAAVMGGGQRRFGLALVVIIILIIATITLSLIWRRGASADPQALGDPPASQVTTTHV